MNINKNFILLVGVALFFYKIYCPYSDIDRFIINRLTTLKDKLVDLQQVLQESIIQDPLQKKIKDFVTALPISQIPIGLIYEFYKEAHISPSKSQEELNVEDLTAQEKAVNQVTLREFSDLVQEIDQSLRQTVLITFLRDQLEDILKEKADALTKSVIGRKLQAKIDELFQEINEAQYPVEIYRKILESLRVLPILPAREEPLGFTEIEKQREKDLLAQHAAIMRKIQKKENKNLIRERYVMQLRNAYSKIGRADEEERPLPPLPTKPQEEERPLPPLPSEEKETPQEQPLPEREKTEVPQKQEGTIPPPPPLPEQQESQKEEISKSLEERLKEAAEKLKKSKEEAEETQESSKEKTWEDVLKKALEERRSSIGEDEDEEEEGEWEYNPWD